MTVENMRVDFQVIGMITQTNHIAGNGICIHIYSYIYIII